jgi:hypothetical protein
MKEALMKAGLISKDTEAREKEKARKEKIEKKGPAQHGIHQHHIRTDCGHCKKNQPDVEFYEHTNRSVEAKWLCIPCADKAWIKDEAATPNQAFSAVSLAPRRNFLRSPLKNRLSNLFFEI